MEPVRLFLFDRCILYGVIKNRAVTIFPTLGLFHLPQFLVFLAFKPGMMAAEDKPVPALHSSLFSVTFKQLFNSTGEEWDGRRDDCSVVGSSSSSEGSWNLWEALCFSTR